jgi:hypothetical protein
MTGVQSPFPGDIEIASKADQERVSVAQFLWRLRISDKKRFRPRQFRARSAFIQLSCSAHDQSLRRQSSAERALSRQSRPAVPCTIAIFEKFF